MHCADLIRRVAVRCGRRRVHRLRFEYFDGHLFRGGDEIDAGELPGVEVEAAEEAHAMMIARGRREVGRSASGKVVEQPLGMCPCGRPLHYQTEESARVMEQVVRERGEWLDLRVGQEPYVLNRHYIALHGLNGRARGSSMTPAG